MGKLNKQIAKHLEATNKEMIENDYYRPKLFGKGKTVEFEIDGLVKSFCKLTEWTNGEGYDLSFQTEVSKGKFEDKKIDLHLDELDVLFACLNHFEYFGVKEKKEKKKEKKKDV